MPNWCSNQLTVTGPKTDLRAFKKMAVGHSPWEEVAKDEKLNPLNFHSLVSIPAVVLQAGYQEAGYDWERANWGCKWGACEARLIDSSDGELLYDFDTAWSPPIEFLETVAKEHPNLTFILEYDEPGIGFKGLARFNGETKEDHCLSR